MKPKSLSASALHVAELCLARYKAEWLDRGKTENNSAASLGTAVHGALEAYVKAVYINKKEKPGVDLLLKFFIATYTLAFDSDRSGPIWDDGVEMLKNWYKRTSFEGFEVVSCEEKENFPIKTSIGEIPVNYLWDRHDKLEENVYRVVDYKTSRWNVTHDDLKKKIQARLYGLAAQIKYPDAERIWVEFDMLRYDSVGIVFTREENIATWNFVKRAAKRILDTPDENPEETLNPECNWCIRKLQCTALRSNVAAGGAYSLKTITETVDLRAVLDWQHKGINAALKELDSRINNYMQEKDVLEITTNLAKVSVTARTTREIDSYYAEKIVGEEIFSEYGTTNLTMGMFDKLVKDDRLTTQQKKQLKQLVKSKMGDQKIRVEPINPIDGESS